MVPAGIGAAAAVLVGRAIGRGDPAAARHAAWVSLACGGGFMAVAGLVLFVVPGPFARAYTSDAAVAAVAATFIPIAGVFQLFDGLQVVAAGVLRGAGDTRAPLLIGVAGFWLVGIPVSLYLRYYTTAGAAGLWWGCVAGLGAVAFFLLLRVRFRLRGELHRVVVDAPMADTAS
jgi:multidrug resistance protein, MATE family